MVAAFFVLLLLLRGLFGQIIAWTEYLYRIIAHVGLCFDPCSIVVFDMYVVLCLVFFSFCVTCVYVVIFKAL